MKNFRNVSGIVRLGGNELRLKRTWTNRLNTFVPRGSVSYPTYVRRIEVHVNNSNSNRSTVHLNIGYSNQPCKFRSRVYQSGGNFSFVLYTLPLPFFFFFLIPRENSTDSSKNRNLKFFASKNLRKRMYIRFNISSISFLFLFLFLSSNEDIFFSYIRERITRVENLNFYSFVR